jgi:hypothetical protein
MRTAYAYQLRTPHGHSLPPDAEDARNASPRKEEQMNGQTRNKSLAAIFTAAVVGSLFMGGIGGYAVAKAEVSTTGAASQAIAQRWDHEERAASDSITRASRWDHEERTFNGSAGPAESPALVP